jgi:hypothetical protein
MLAVSTNNGTAGRSREIRRAVDPDFAATYIAPPPKTN